MYKLTSMAAASLLLAAVHAMPNPNPHQPRAADAADATDAALEPWVTVNDDGTPSTVTPVLSTISGTPTVISGAPHDVTATVFTYTSYGKVITSTGAAPGPTAAANSNSTGVFGVCNNKDGEFAPWCRPEVNSTLYVDTTYYFTWDPTYFSAPNATLQIIGNHINKTTGEVETESPAFTSAYTMARFGYLTIPIKSEHLRGQGSQNISLSLIGVVKGERVERSGPQIKVTTRPGPVADAHHKAPVGAAVYIAIPTIFGFIIACVIGTCIYNRHHRRIELKSAMGRNYNVTKKGRGVRSRLGLGGRNKKAKANERIQLMEREIHAEGGEVYRDLPDPADRPRRDSDALGSLASTPTEDRRMDFGAGEGRNNQTTGNAFRDELRRQDNERP
ncbi:hypothetical protein F5B22DRAFT_627298 [Xylaria bambusicola]|uniref:uncharacterized protein n=1 Tax=Xylaria bambusicola TaxID=326684 RepID=UPI00200873F0|nr:uncharacterized protein F5B22DRAFT_627298 [Xylaria bambusicola]KAI0505659.1 hypothetical protein F5B22DRAFT_627298 [Xylaria bambusicola]